MSLPPALGMPAEDGSDCVTCGRCCHHPPSTVALLYPDEERLRDDLARLTVIHPQPPHFRFMKNDGERCGALDTSVPGRFPCSIYDRRPDGCRTVEPRSPSCLEARRLGHLGSSVEFRYRP